MKALTTKDIEDAMVGDPQFQGIFAINRVKDLKVPKDQHVTFIANLQADNLPSNHWVAVRRSGGAAQYFDSAGRVPPPEIQRWLVKNSSNWTYNNKLLQSLNDDTSCGYLCIAFVKNILE